MTDKRKEIKCSKCGKIHKYSKYEIKKRAGAERICDCGNKIIIE